MPGNTNANVSELLMDGAGLKMHNNRVVRNYLRLITDAAGLRLNERCGDVRCVTDKVH